MRAILISDSLFFGCYGNKDHWKHHHEGEELPDASLWNVAKTTARNTPKQTNAKDCGILQCMTMNYICEDLPLNFDENNCKLFRGKMALALLSNFVE